MDIIPCFHQNQIQIITNPQIIPLLGKEPTVLEMLMNLEAGLSALNKSFYVYFHELSLNKITEKYTILKMLNSARVIFFSQEDKLYL